MHCPDDLIRKIQNSPILPKPEVEELLYSWDWREYISAHLSGKSLKNHSFFFAFMIKKEHGIAVFRAKKYPFNEEWIPAAGIMLLKRSIEFLPVKSSEFRIDSLCLEKVFNDLYMKYFPILETNEKRKAEVSWERLRTVLENLPKQQMNLAPMRLLRFPKQVPAPPSTIPQYLEPFMNLQTPELIGQHCIVEPIDSHFQSELRKGMDVAIYTESRKDRPWLGRVVEVQDDGLSFEVQWFKKKGRSSTYYALTNKDGSIYSSLLDTETVMFWEFTENKKIDSFELSKDWLEKIQLEYESHDICYQ